MWLIDVGFAVDKFEDFLRTLDCNDDVQDLLLALLAHSAVFKWCELAHTPRSGDVGSNDAPCLERRHDGGSDAFGEHAGNQFLGIIRHVAQLASFSAISCGT